METGLKSSRFLIQSAKHLHPHPPNQSKLEILYYQARISPGCLQMLVPRVVPQRQHHPGPGKVRAGLNKLTGTGLFSGVNSARQ